jgi:uncharacterized protein
MVPADVKVSVVFCARGVEDTTDLVLAAGSTVRDAVEASRLIARHPQLSVETLDVGVWGRSCSLERPLENGDRIELYRPLTMDPKEARRRRAEVRRKRLR